jgi:membrane protease YdiL (CAAX protease family)
MDEKKFPEPVEALVLILITFGFIFFASLVLAFIYIIISSETSLAASAKFLFIFGSIPFLIVPIIYVKIKNYDANRIFRINAVSNEIVIYSLLLGFSLTIITDELDRIIQILVPPPQWFVEQLQSLQANSVSDWIILLIGVVLLASLSEELLFRGFLQVSLERKGDVTRAVVLSSLTWTLIHVNPYWAVQIFITGIFIGFIAWRTNSIIPAIIIHALNNLLSLLFLNFKLDEKLGWYLYGNHVSPLLFIIAVLILVWSIQRITQVVQKEKLNSI